MATLGSLVVSLAVDTAKFQGDLGRAATIAESRMRNIKDVSTKALGAITIAATAAGAALTVALKGAVDRADNMRDLAQASGVTVEQLSRLAFAGKQSGVEIEQIGKALAKLSQDGATDANAALLKLADQFAAMPDGARKTALAIEQFGLRLGPGLIPLLNEGADGLRKMAEQSDAVGNTLSTSAAAGADELNDKLGLLRATIDGLSNTLAAQMLPTLNGIASEFLRAATGAGNLQRMSAQLATGLKLLVDVGFSVYQTFNVVGTAIGALAAAAVSVAKGDFAGAAAVYKGHLEDIVESNRKANVFLETLWSDRAEMAEASAERITGGNGDLPSTAKAPKPDFGFTDGTRASAEAAAKRAEDYYAERAFQAELAEDIDRKAVQGLEEIAGKMEQIHEQTARQNAQMSVFAEQSARNMQDSFAQFLFDPFDQGLKGMLAGFLDTIRRMVAEAASAQILGSLFNFIGGKAGGGVGAFFSNMAGGILGKRAGGGPVSAGGAYLVGERGPELLQMGSMGGNVIPNHAMGGGITINNHIDARGADAERIMAMLPPLLKQNSDQTVARIRDMNGRGRL
jgi:hypothetical protein